MSFYSTENKTLDLVIALTAHKLTPPPRTADFPCRQIPTIALIKDPSNQNKHKGRFHHIKHCRKILPYPSQPSRIHWLRKQETKIQHFNPLLNKTEKSSCHSRNLLINH